jgi:hypothetical protein
VTYFGLLSLKNDVNVPSKSNKKKTLKKISFLLASWKVNDENSKIRIQSEAWIRGSGSTPKCHGSGTLLCRNRHVSGQLRQQ